MIDLSEWDRMLQGMTPGPWNVERRWSNDCEIVPRITCKPDDDRGCGWVADCIGAPYLGHKTTLPNAHGIAFLRNNAAALVEECRRYREALEHIRDHHESPYSSRRPQGVMRSIARTALSESQP